MKILLIALLSIQIGLTGCSIPKEYEVIITQEQINAAIAKASHQKAVAYGLMTVTLNELALKVGEPVERIGVVAQPIIKIIGLQPFSVKIKGFTKLAYDAPTKVFFLSELNIESIVAPNLPKSMVAMEAKIKEAVNNLFSEEFIRIPVYRLHEDGSAKENMARKYLKSIKIDDGKIVAVLSAK